MVSTGLQRRPRAPELGVVLAELRRSRGVSQLELAGAARVSQRHLSFCELGRARPSPETLARIAAALELSAFVRRRLLALSAPRDRLEAAPPDLRNFMVEAMRLLDPHPAFVRDRERDVVEMNFAAKALFEMTERVDDAPNLIRLLMSPDGLRKRMPNWEATARRFAQQLYWEFGSVAARDRVAAALGEALAQADIPSAWFHPDPDASLLPTEPFRLQLRSSELRFRVSVVAPPFAEPDALCLECLLPAEGGCG